MMMRKKTKMAWSVALSAAMAAGLLAGCGSNGGTESTSGSTAASSAKTESSASDTTDTSDRPTYKIATVRWTDTWPTDFLHEGVMKEIEDKMNINIDWQVYYNSDWSEQKSLLLASGCISWLHLLNTGRYGTEQIGIPGSDRSDRKRYAKPESSL